MTSPVSIRVMRVFISLNHSVSQSYSVKFRYLIVISVSQAISISLTHSLSPPYLSLFSLLRFIDFALFKRNCPICFYGCILGGTIVPQCFLSVSLFYTSAACLFVRSCYFGKLPVKSQILAGWHVLELWQKSWTYRWFPEIWFCTNCQSGCGDLEGKRHKIYF